MVPVTPTPAQFSGTERFKLMALLGRGATGAVYTAFDAERHCSVALKLLTNWHPLGIERFKNEFRALQDVRHRNLVELRELLFEAEHWFLTMELVSGGDFLSYVRGAEQPLAAAPSLTDASPSEVTLAVNDAAPPLVPRGDVLPRAFDAARLRDAFIQLTSGLSALHRASKIHRDVKPSNVLVDVTGRVVIVDFGLVAHVEAGGSAPRAALLGTPRYMSPEQASRGNVGPPSDWYSAGALLYEALTGRLPPASRPAASGAYEQAPHPQQLNAQAPDDLSQLSLRLLQIEPSQRPDAEQVLQLLGARPYGRARGSVPVGAGGDGAFVGREAELSLLLGAFERVRQGEAASVVIEGQSGVGKTSLLRELLRRARLLEPGAGCFQGRCFERESLPYKAIDGVMDALGRQLVERSAAERSRLLPASAALIGRVFPVLRRVPGFEAAAHGDEQGDPQIQRLRFFAALRELWVRLAAEAPTLVLLDDMQWSDADSLALLSALLQPPAAPRLLLVVAKRPGGLLEQLPLPGKPLQIALGNLAAPEAESLLRSLLAEQHHELDNARVAALAREAQGHPLFLRELSLKLDAGEPASTAPLRLDDALWQRIVALPDTARRLVELTAVAGQPIAQSVVREALLRDGSVTAAAELERHLTDLRHACLLRTSGARPSDAIETYHDRIREAVLTRLEPRSKARDHLLVARALEQAGALDAEVLVGHFQAAGEPERAFDYAILAAEQAKSALAFERAARLYQLSLGLKALSSERRRELQSKQAEALASAGRGFDAAQAYAEAATGDDSLLGLHRQRLGAEQLLRSGHIDAGIRAVSKVLRKLELPVPRTSGGALASLLVQRARIAWRGFGYRERTAEEVSALERSRIDGLWTAATCLTMFDNARSAELQCRGILRALDGGTPLQVLRAHTAEAIFLATAGAPNRPAIARVLDAAEQLAERLGDAYALGWIGLSRGATAFLLGDWQAGEQKCAAAEAAFREHAGAQWELGSARAFGTWAAMMRGSFGQVAVRVPGYVDEAEQRGDRYAATMQMTGFSNVAWLCRHDVATARRMLGLAEARWPGARFDVPRYLNMFAAASIELYEGNGRAAHARVLRDWAPLRFGIAFRAQITRFGMRTIRGLSALAAFDEAREEQLLADAEGCAQAVLAEKVAWSGAFAGIILGGAALRRGQPEAALARYAEAEAKAERTGMQLHSALLGMRRGQILGGAAGRALVDAGLSALSREAVASPEAMANMLTPRRFQ